MIDAKTLACLFLLGSSLECEAADLTIMAEDAAEPFSRADGTGFANDVVKAAFQAVGVNVALDVVPYARCKKDVEDGKVPACFSMSWYQGVEKTVIFSKRPVFEVYADVFLSAKSLGRIVRLGDIGKGDVVGIVNEYEYPDAVSALRRGGTTFQTAPNDGANLKMLARDRIDVAIVMTNDLVPRTQKAIDAGVAAQVRYAFRAGVEQSYVGFSRKHPRGETARAQFDSGYEKILADGTVSALRRKWTAKAAP